MAKFLKFLGITFLFSFMLSCTTNQAPTVELNKGPVGLHCSDQEAIEIANISVKETYPEHYEIFLNKDGQWSFSYEEIKGKNQFYVIYQKVLREDERVGHMENSDSFYYETMAVFLSSNCELLDISYNKEIASYE